MLVIVDEFTRECMSIDVARKLDSDDVLERLAWLMATRGVPAHFRSDNGPEMTAKVVRDWLAKVGVMTLHIDPDSPWQNGIVESFNGRLRDELLSSEIFDSLAEARHLATAGGCTAAIAARSGPWASRPRRPLRRSARGGLRSGGQGGS
jgi:putative transposase